MIKLIRKGLIIFTVAILVPSMAWSQEESNWEFNLAPLIYGPFRLTATWVFGEDE